MGTAAVPPLKNARRVVRITEGTQGCAASQAAIARVSSSEKPLAIRPITVDGRSPERNACIAATISAGSRPRSGGTFVSPEALGGWQPEHDVAPGGGSAVVAPVAIPKTSGNALTRPATLATLSRNVGEGPQGSSPAPRERRDQ